MSIIKKSKQNIDWEVGSTNVFADLEMADAKEKLVKAELAFKINQLFDQKGLKQTEAAKLLKVDQAKISLLKRGRLKDFSVGRLVKFLTLLNQDIDIVVKKGKAKANLGKLRVVYA